MKENIQRFRIYSPHRELMHRCDSLRDVEKWLLTRDMGLEAFMVEDLVDDIEVSADDILEAMRDGELYEDLQGF